MYRIFNGTTPQYMAELCQLCSDDRLWSSLHQDYFVPRTYRCLADSSFSVAGPILHGTLYRSNFVEHPLTARFAAVLKHFYFLSFSPSDIVFYSLHFSLAIFIVRRPWTSDGGRHSKWLIDWLIVYCYSRTRSTSPQAMLLRKTFLSVISCQPQALTGAKPAVIKSWTMKFSKRQVEHQWPCQRTQLELWCCMWTYHCPVKHSRPSWTLTSYWFPVPQVVWGWVDPSQYTISFQLLLVLVLLLRTLLRQISNVCRKAGVHYNNENHHILAE